MNLTLATLLTGIFLLALGFLLLRYPSSIAEQLKQLPRSKPVTFVLLLTATAWVLWNVSQLGQADFGDYKVWLAAFFLILSVGSWFYVPDFLGIRALAVLLLLICGALLQAAFLQEPTTRLFLSGFCYFVIIIALYLAAVPYRFRDWVHYVDQHKSKRIGLGFFTAAYGALLLLIPLTY